MEQTNFNPTHPTIMHIDLNSCFASVEQQANPLLRGKPVVVAAYTTGNGCILATSREAKRLGIKTGMPVWEGKNIYPRLVVLPPDPEKYRWVNRKLRALLSSYTVHLSVESIDEMVMDLANSPALDRHHMSLRGVNDEAISKNLKGLPRRRSGLTMTECVIDAMVTIGQEIKQRIKQEIGDWLTVSIGIAPNRYLAKVASGLHKPDGLDSITKKTIEEVFQTIQLEDLCGIKEGNATRLQTAGIRTPVEFYRASPAALINAFHSKTGWSWWQRLHGWEDGVLYKNFETPGGPQKTFGQSFALGMPHIPQDPELWKILSQLIIKMGRRLRYEGFVARGIHISCLFRDYTHWGKGYLSVIPMFADSDFFFWARTLLVGAPQKLVRILAVTSYDLSIAGMGQMTLWNTDDKKRKITDALDKITDRWGEFTVTSGRMLAMDQKVLDRIAFGRSRERVRV